MIKKMSVLAVLTILSGCASSPPKTPDAEQQTKTPQAFVDQGYAYLKVSKIKQAIAEFDAAIKLCQDFWEDEKQVYTARTLVENLSYLTAAAASGKSAEVLDTSCSDAHYLMGYALIDFGKIEEAETQLQKAVAMAPKNAMYLSELGHIYQSKRDWSRALSYFTEAESAAEIYSPEEVKVDEICRAKRGMGFNLIELGKLDDAEKKFREALALDAKDKMALSEIEYIRQLRSGNAQ